MELSIKPKLKPRLKSRTSRTAEANIVDILFAWNWLHVDGKGARVIPMPPVATTDIGIESGVSIAKRIVVVDATDSLDRAPSRIGGTVVGGARDSLKLCPGPAQIAKTRSNRAGLVTAFNRRIHPLPYIASEIPNDMTVVESQRALLGRWTAAEI